MVDRRHTTFRYYIFAEVAYLHNLGGIDKIDFTPDLLVSA